MNSSYMIERDVESAYGSDVSSNSRMETKKETFSIQESAAGNHHWFQWIKHKFREYMLSEALLLITIVIIIMNSYRLSAQNQETQAMISDFRMEFKLLSKQMVNKEFPVFNKKEEEASEKILKKLEEIKEFEKVRVEPVEVATNVRIPTVPSELFEDVPTVPKIQQIPTNSTLKKFNAASFMNHAKIDTSRSSSSNLNPTFGRDQSNLVLVDRSESPADKAWCTYEKNPVLTVNLAKYTKPISVSYQHSNWNGTIPDDAPKIYDVMACLDYECEKRKLLVTNCEYKPLQMNGTTEQLCNIPPNSINSPIGKVQFHFRKNYGNTEKTCVSLVRVYSDEVEPIKEKSLDDAEQCSALKYDYHNNSIKYHWISSLQNQYNSLQEENPVNEVSHPENDEYNLVQKIDRGKIEEMISEILKEVKIKPAETTKVEVNESSTAKPVHQQDAQSSLKSSSLKKFNAASLIIGAEVDTSRSSSSNLDPFLLFDQTNLVLVDRPNPPADRAWCTYEKEPILTVNLGKVVKPISVSYQHSKWNKTIPNEAPLIYDVKACLDDQCDKVQMLVSSCGYNSYGYWNDRQEQVCNIPLNSNTSPIGKIQFHFRKNHGITERTCVNLVRVYAEAAEVPTIKESYLKPVETCQRIRYDYHNSPILFKLFTRKYCGLLYSKKCCTDCPECCDECWIHTVDGDNVAAIVNIVMFAIGAVLILLVFLISKICKVCR